MTRTSSLPARASAATCRTVAATSAVSVLVIDWTTIGWPEPTGTPPTRAVTVWRRVSGGHGGNITLRLHGPEIRACEPRLRRAAPRSPASRPTFPSACVTNADLARTLDTSDEWIVTRTGIRERRRGAPGETTSTMGAEAVRRLMAANAGSGPTTSTPSSSPP